MIPFERSRQIFPWLRRAITVEEAEVRYGELDEAIIKLTGTSGGFLEHFRNRIVAKFHPGDELWLYDTSAESWEHLCGESGLALVRDGRVIDLIMERMN